MEIKIMVKESTYERLQRYAKPFEDTPDSVLNRVLDELEKSEGATVVEESSYNERRIDPWRLPNLTHTKILKARIDGKDMERPKWNPLLERIIVIAMKRLSDFKKVQELCSANMVRGSKTEDG
ncbi:MAG: hypothetical protein OD811_00115, partial [Alphaproteobacteria bacterium]